MSGLLAILLPALIGLVLWRLSASSTRSRDAAARVQSVPPRIAATSSGAEPRPKPDPEPSRPREAASPPPPDPIFVYTLAFRAACREGYITSSRWARLDELADDLSLDPEVRKEIEELPRREALAKHLGGVFEADVFTPDDAAALQDWMTEMRCSAEDIDPAQLLEMQHLAAAWRLLHDPIRIVEVPIALNKNEVCYATAAAIWSELRENRYSANVGPMLRLPLAPGLSFRVAGYKRYSLNSSALQPLDHGELYITNRRIILTGKKKNYSVRMPSILKVTAAGDGIIIDKATGRSPHLQLFGIDPLHTAIVVRRLVAEANK